MDIWAVLMLAGLVASGLYLRDCKVDRWDFTNNQRQWLAVGAGVFAVIVSRFSSVLWPGMLTRILAAAIVLLIVGDVIRWRCKGAIYEWGELKRRAVFALISLLAIFFP